MVEMRDEWKPWLAHLDDVISVASGAIQAYDGVRHTQQEHAFILLLNRATENLGAILCLFRAGWENDATALLRTLTDIYLDVRYIRANRAERLERFRDYSIVANLWKKQLVEALYARKVDDLIREDFSRASTRGIVRDDIRCADDYVAAYNAEVARAQAKWEFKRSGWAKHDAARKANIVDQHVNNGTNETENVYNLIYRMTSEALHSGIGGALRGVTFEGTSATLEHQARTPRASGLLVLAFSSFLFMKIVDYVNAELELGLAPDLLRLEKAHCTLLGPVRLPSSSATGPSA